MAGTLVGLLALASDKPAADSPVSKAAMLALLDRYTAGDYAGATRAIEAIDAGGADATAQAIAQAFDAWRAVTPTWMASDGGAVSDRRRLIAATVALEIARSHPDIGWFHRLRFFSWACGIMRDHPSGTETERLWYLLSVAVVEEADASTLMLPATTPLRGPFAYRFTAMLTEADRAEILSGHLTHAKAAFPDEARLQLSEVRLRAQTAMRPQSSASTNWLGAFEYPVKSGTTIAGQAAQTSVGLGQVPAIVGDFEALGRSERVRADVQLELGYLAMRVRAWDDALDHLHQVLGLTTEPFLLCMSHYLSGWVEERSGRRNEAIAQYRLALDQMPRARSVSILLSVQLAEAGQQADAFDVLDAGLKANLGASQMVTEPREARSDPWFLFQRGDAWRIPSYLAELRGALR